MELGKKIADRLKELKLTQTELAARSGITQAAINKYIKNRSKPAYNNILKLAQVLKVPPGWFFPADESREISPQRSRFHRGDVIVFPQTGKIRRGAKFVIGHYLPMRHLPPPTQSHYAGVAHSFYGLIFNALVQRSPADDHPSPVLAIDWKPMGSSWLFRLRGGVQFHDGKPLTVEDVAWSYEQYLTNNPQERHIQGVGIVDESLVAIHLKAPCPLSHLAMPPIMPKGMGESPEQWIGTGPFQATALDPGFWRLRVNPFYFFRRPFFDEVHIREYDDPQALEAALVSSAVHFAIGIDQPGENFVVRAEADVQRYHLHFMTLFGDSVSANRSFRQAVALGLDRKALAFAAGLRAPLFSAGPFDYLLEDRSSSPPFPPDPQQARQLLKAVGNLKDSVFRVRCHYTNNPHERALESTLAEQLNRLGIPTEGGSPADALLVTRNTRFFENECRLWATDSPEAYNFNRYSNPEVDDLIQQCLNSEWTPSRLSRLRELIQNDVPDIPLFYHEMPVTYVKQLGALKGRMTLMSCLNEISNWYLATEGGAEEGTEVEVEDEDEDEEEKSAVNQ
jgi:ABC-type transport system substrate-binding protein/transcriptional regulator with XRE-family HTH domain